MDLSFAVALRVFTLSTLEQKQLTRRLPELFLSALGQYPVTALYIGFGFLRCEAMPGKLSVTLHMYQQGTNPSRRRAVGVFHHKK